MLMTTIFYVTINNDYFDTHYDQHCNRDDDQDHTIKHFNYDFRQTAMILIPNENYEVDDVYNNSSLHPIMFKPGIV